MSQSDEVRSFYDGYYNDAVAQKRAISARQSVDHLQILTRSHLGTLLDVGSGEGSVLQEIEHRRLATSMDAVEISTSGIERVNVRGLTLLRSIHSFDGYVLPFENKSFDTAIAIHVLEHVEHERIFINELARVAHQVFIEVPLEHTFRLKRSIAMGKAIWTH